ncbi:MAG TPA: DUF3168 domain-containing protein [Phycisphaerales bacterium]|nr:DUF3168 domain-containing protein [Phycisphaerales bacterium]
MPIESAVRQFLLASTAVTDLVGVRIYPVTLPRAPEYPAVRYAVISKVRDVAFGGYTGLCMARVQVDIFSPQYDQAKAIMDAMRKRLCGDPDSADPAVKLPWPAAIGSPAVDVQGIFVDGEDDGYEGADDGFDAGGKQPVEVYSTSADFLIWHKG